jgi:heterodisulfide reductase subunit A-like polyferredoxin
MINDIEMIEKPPATKNNIIFICRTCENFSILDEKEVTYVTADGNLETHVVKDNNFYCSKNNQIILFSQIKEFQTCPEGRW